jgi:hypothetical protein
LPFECNLQRYSEVKDSYPPARIARWGHAPGTEVRRCPLCVYSTSHTSSSSDWLKDLSANEKA